MGERWRAFTEATIVINVCMLPVQRAAHHDLAGARVHELADVMGSSKPEESVQGIMTRAKEHVLPCDLNKRCACGHLRC